VMGRLEEIKKKFQILDDWKITIGLDQTLDGTLYTGQCTINSDKHMAVIYPWRANELAPSDYILHEVLHIALRAALVNYECQELFVQDLCTQFKEKDQEVERLEKLVKKAFEEGWEHKDKDLTTIENGWYESDAQKSLKEK